MNIYLLSDLHVEFFRNFHLPNIDDIDVVVLAGDLKPGSGTLDVAVAFQQHCQAPVILVAGNHEFYGYSYKHQLSALRCEAAKLPDIHFLENESVIIGGVRFLGCTLWSNFALFGDDYIARAKATAQQCIADFDVIRCGDRKFMPDDAAAEFELSYAWLNNELAKPFTGKTVVVTHFLPHKAGIHPDYGSGGDYLTPYFTSDCSALMQQYPIAAWLYGHTHNSIDVVVEGGTRLVSNQRGYPNERHSYTQLDLNKIIVI